MKKLNKSILKALEKINECEGELNDCTCLMEELNDDDKTEIINAYNKAISDFGLLWQAIQRIENLGRDLLNELENNYQ